MKPNYLCIGVQKAGTNSLVEYLNYHPQIFASNELSFFSKDLSDGELTTEDIKCYEDQLTTNRKIIGEKCACYSVLPYAMDRIYNYDKNMKLIIILREPISRAFSAYNMIVPKEYPQYMNNTDDQILDLFKTQALYKFSEITGNSPYVIVRGYYDEILEYILSKFPRENLYIGISEEIIKDKLKYYNEIYEFLGADKLKHIDNTLDANIGNYIKSIPKSLEKYLYTIYKPHNENLYKILGRKINIWENYYDELKTYLD